MGRVHFGTDGIRGRVGSQPMTVDFALHLASAAAKVLAPRGGTVLIGKDTRLSGYLFEAALEAGFVASGVDVLLMGRCPRPAIAYMTRHLSCSFGVVISASHNLYEDNGIKFFDRQGLKLSDEIEERIEAELAAAAGHARLARARAGAPTGHLAAPLPGVLRRHSASRHESARPEARRGLRQWSGVQGRARGFWPIWRPRSCRSAARRTGAISTEGCGSTRPELLQLTVAGRARSSCRHRLRWRW